MAKTKMGGKGKPGVKFRGDKHSEKRPMKKNGGKGRI